MLLPKMSDDVDIFLEEGFNRIAEVRAINGEGNLCF